jgi:hypothetical protein
MAFTQHLLFTNLSPILVAVQGRFERKILGAGLLSYYVLNVVLVLVLS